MFGLKSKHDEAAGEKMTLSDLARLREHDVAIVFKHSPTCPVSWHAQTQVRKFTASHPGMPVYTVFVRQDRDLSNKVAEVSGIRHESPQVIVFRHGRAVLSASHQNVTIGFLEEAIRNPVPALAH